MYKNMNAIDNIISYRKRLKGKEQETKLVHDFGDKRIEIWSCEKFHDIDECPNQRCTEKRVKKALKNHLKEEAITHNEVAVAVYPDGTFQKINGHTRDSLWYDNLLKKPNYLIVMVYKVQDKDDVIDVYNQYDNNNAVETNTDKLHGAYNNFEFEPKSRLMNTSMTSVIGSFFQKENKNDARYMINAVFTLLPYLKVADEYNFKCSKETCSAPFKAALINAIILDGDSFQPEFWEGLFGNGIEMKDGKKNYIGHAIHKCDKMESKSAGSVFPQIVNILTHSYMQYKKKGNVMISSCYTPNKNKHCVIQQVLKDAN